jgi:hypothetical protein
MEHKSAEEQISILEQKYQAIKPYLNERSRRIWAASEARTLGYGGQKIVHEATGLSGTTISRGLVELAAAEGERVALVVQPSSIDKFAAPDLGLIRVHRVVK